MHLSVPAQRWDVFHPDDPGEVGFGEEILLTVLGPKEWGKARVGERFRCLPGFSLPSAAAVILAGFVNVSRQNAAYARRAANFPSISACWMMSVLRSVRQPATTAHA